MPVNPKPSNDEIIKMYNIVKKQVKEESNQTSNQESEYKTSPFENLPPNLWVQAFLAQVESNQTFHWLNKDFGYSLLDMGQIESEQLLLDFGSHVAHNLQKLNAVENDMGIKLDPTVIVSKYSAPNRIWGKAAALAVLMQSKDGFARKLAVTQRFEGNLQDMRRKWLGMKRKSDETTQMEGGY